jgi:hypothetical protein
VSARVFKRDHERGISTENPPRKTNVPRCAVSRKILGRRRRRGVPRLLFRWRFAGIRTLQLPKDTNHGEAIKPVIHCSRGKTPIQSNPIQFKSVASAADAEYRDCSCRGQQREAKSPACKSQHHPPSEHCCLTPRSSGASTAWRPGREAPTQAIMRLAARAPRRCRPLSSNVRPHKALPRTIEVPQSHARDAA